MREGRIGGRGDGAVGGKRGEERRGGKVSAVEREREKKTKL